MTTEESTETTVSRIRPEYEGQEARKKMGVFILDRLRHRVRSFGKTQQRRGQSGPFSFTVSK